MQCLTYVVSMSFSHNYWKRPCQSCLQYWSTRDFMCVLVSEKIGYKSSSFSNVLLHKNNSRCHVVKLQVANSDFWQNQQIERCHVLWFQFWLICSFVNQQLQRCRVVRFKFCGFSDAHHFLFCRFLKFSLQLYCELWHYSCSSLPPTCSECKSVLSHYQRC